MEFLSEYIDIIIAGVLPLLGVLIGSLANATGQLINHWLTARKERADNLLNVRKDVYSKMLAASFVSVKDITERYTYVNQALLISGKGLYKLLLEHKEQLNKIISLHPHSFNDEDVLNGLRQMNTRIIEEIRKEILS